MIDKPTVEEFVLLFDGRPEDGTTRRVKSIARLHPNWFAPEPDPVEELLSFECDNCDSRDIGCDPEGICRTKRDALRACVADLRKRAEGK